MREMWKSDLINPLEGQKPPLDRRPDTSREKLVPTRNTVTPTIVGLRNWTPLTDAEGRTLGVSEVTRAPRRTCGKPGHSARDCRSKNLVVPRQINAMLRKIPNSQDDTRGQTDTEADAPEPTTTTIW